MIFHLQTKCLTCRSSFWNPKTERGIFWKSDLLSENPKVWNLFSDWNHRLMIPMSKKKVGKKNTIQQLRIWRSLASEVDCMLINQKSHPKNTWFRGVQTTETHFKLGKNCNSKKESRNYRLQLHLYGLLVYTPFINSRGNKPSESSPATHEKNGPSGEASWGLGVTVVGIYWDLLKQSRPWEAMMVNNPLIHGKGIVICLILSK